MRYQLDSGGVLSRLESFEARRGRLIEPVDAAVREESREGRGDPLRCPEHPERQALDHAHWAIAVHDEAGQSVCLAPAEAIGVGDQARRPAVLPGSLEPAHEESGVDGLVTPSEQAAAERRAGVVEALAEISAARIKHLDGLAGLGKALEVVDLAPVNPRVPGVDSLLGAALENEPGHGSGAPLYLFRRTTTMSRGW